MALARSYGRIDLFQLDNENIAAYLERVELYYAVNDIEAEKKVSILLTSIGDKTYTLLRNHFAPIKPATKSYNDIEAALKTLFEPPKIVIAERFHFHRRNQRKDESVSDYVAELRRLSTTCEFGGFLDQALRDRLVGGLKSGSAQWKLLTEKNMELTFVKAIEIAEGIEAAETSTHQFSKGSTITVHQVSQPCYRCGRECRFKEAICHACQRKGHLANVCTSTKSGQDRPDPKKQFKKPYRKFRRTKWVQVDDEESSGDADPELPMLKVGVPTSHPITVTLKINNENVKMEVDTGAAITIISEKTKHQLFPKTVLQKSSVKLTTYTGEAMPVLGEMAADVLYDDQRYPLTLTVVAGRGPCLLGHDWLMHLKLDWKWTIYSRTIRAFFNRDLE